MGSGTFYPSVGGDDGYVFASTIRATRDYLYLGNAVDDLHGWVLFRNVVIPNGATITGAFVRFTAYVNSAVTTVNLNVYLNDVDSAVAPTTAQQFYDLVKTSAFTSWDNVPAITDGSQYDTPSIIDAVQEVLDRAGWSSGHAMMAIFLDNGSSGNANRQFSSIEWAGGVERSELHLTWVPIQDPANFLIYRGRDRFRTDGYSEGY